MNTNTRKGRKGQISYQSAIAEDGQETVEKESNVVEENDYGKVMKSTFSITIKSKDEKGEDGKPKVLYKNENEPFKYQTVDTLVGSLRYMGAEKFPEENIDVLSKALVHKDAAISTSIGEAVASILKALNAKFKSDAKSSAYQALVNKYTPLEGEQRQTAIARTINNFVKLASITPEVAIEILKSKGAVPEDYTVQDYKDTPLRRTKGSDEGDED